MNSTKLEPHHLDLPSKSYIFLNMYINLWNNKTKQNRKTKSTTGGPARRNGGPRSRHRHGPETARPSQAPASAAATDARVPHDRETDRGGRKDDGVARRRWQLRWGHRCQCVLLTRVHLGTPSIEAILVARGSGDGHGGARPWVDRLRRGDGVMALVAYPTIISITHWT